MFIHPLISTEWDGYTLHLFFSDKEKLTSIALDINDTYFANLTVDENGYTYFKFKISPSGKKIIEIMPRLSRNGKLLLEKPLQLEIGKKSINLVVNNSFSLSPFIFYEKKFSPEKNEATPRIKIIVPIYNATETVKNCLESVIKNTRRAEQLILIDDASTDPTIAPLLNFYRDQPGICVLTNQENLGFTRTINRGLSQADGCDVIILNADTEVGPNWLQGLFTAAYSQSDIGTATAVSDNAGAFSVPELEQENPLPQQWTFEQSVRACWQQAGLVYPELPTGNGFCMYIKAAVIKRIGYFDEIAFPQGYGEENDFCMRAQKAGYRHVIAGNVLVRHARSQSFGVERRLALGEAGMAVLRQRYPDYEAQVGATLFSFERLVLNWRIRHTWQNADNIYQTYPPRPRVLFYKNSPNLSGMFLKKFEPWRLIYVESELSLERYGQTGWVLEQHTQCEEEVSLITNWILHYAIEILCFPKSTLRELQPSQHVPLICLLDNENMNDFSLVEKLEKCVEDAHSFTIKKPSDHYG